MNLHQEQYQCLGPRESGLVSEECNSDYVEISYGSFSQKYCCGRSATYGCHGSSIPGPFVCSCSCTGVTVRFHSDAQYNYPGFRAVWTDIPGKPAGSQCSGDMIIFKVLCIYHTNTGKEDRCVCGTKCGPWQSEGLYCISTQPLTHLQPCDYSSRAQLCDTGLMCELGVCVRADKYDLNKWQHALLNKPDISIITLDFIAKYLAWKFPLKYHGRVEHCITLNFGSQKIESLAMISMTLESNFNWTDQRTNVYNNKLHSSCFLIFIGGKYVQVLKEVLEKVDTISKELLLLPHGVFITEDEENHRSHLPHIEKKYPLVTNKTIVSNVLYYSS